MSEVLYPILDRNAGCFSAIEMSEGHGGSEGARADCTGVEGKKNWARHTAELNY